MGLFFGVRKKTKQNDNFFEISKIVMKILGQSKAVL